MVCAPHVFLLETDLFFIKIVCLCFQDWSQNAEICANDPECKTWHHDDPVLQQSGGPGSHHHTAHTWGSSIDATRNDPMVGCMKKKRNEKKTPFGHWVDHMGNCISRGKNWDFATNQQDRKGPLVTYTQLMDIIHGNKHFGTYNGFRQALEGTPHNTQHNMLGGHMRSLESPADPIFFMHHCQVDRIWAMWQDCHDHDKLGRAPTTEDVPNYGASSGFKVGLREKLMFEHPVQGDNVKHIIPSWNAEKVTPEPFHSSTHMYIPVVYAPDEMMKIMKDKQRRQVCNYDTHESALIELGHANVLQRVHQKTAVGKQLVEACQKVVTILEEQLKDAETLEDPADGHAGAADPLKKALLRAADLQCVAENKKAYGEGGSPPLHVRYIKRWLNQGIPESDRFQNVFEHRPELLLPRCALFEGDTMHEKRKKMREAITKALEESDDNSLENREHEEGTTSVDSISPDQEESTPSIRGSTDTGF